MHAGFALSTAKSVMPKQIKNQIKVMSDKITLTGTNLLELADAEFKAIYEAKRSEYRVLTTTQEATDIQARAKSLGLED